MRTKTEILKLWKRADNNYNRAEERRGIPSNVKARLLERYAGEIGAYEKVLDMSEKSIKKALGVK